jgi:glycosyltransferase involved in cell wall biosynthesis
LPYAPAERLREHLCSADVHLISMDSRWEGTLLPSKLQASFAVGKPVIFVGARTQDMARWVLESGGGWVVDEDDVPGLRAAVAEAAAPAERALRGARGRAYAERHFDRDRNVARFISLACGG